LAQNRFLQVKRYIITVPMARYSDPARFGRGARF